MGRYSGYGTKVELDGLLSLDTAKLNQWSYFSGYRTGQITWTQRPSGRESEISVIVDTTDTVPHVRLQYATTDRDTGGQRYFDYRIDLTSTPCYYGGKRWWFECPLVVNNVACGRRSRVIYKCGDYFGCRVCQNLCYSVQNENHHGGFNRLFSVLENEKRADELLQKITVQFYKGKPTRKMLRYMSLRMRAVKSYEALGDIDELLRK